ncbi:MAG: phosphoenolpyruvate carboxykinase (ATP) [Thermoplasmatales archaeon]|nr:phosphoenolpyruvate carboxykinase (ATP) [Thermoplasmatales archaeon]
MHIKNPSDDFFKEFLKPYYALTSDGQYLFASRQKGRLPDRVFYMAERLGKGQKRFDEEEGKEIFRIVEKYIKNADVIEIDGCYGDEWKTGVKVFVSIENPHSGYVAWMGKQMLFPFEGNANCFNFIIPEGLPEAKEISKNYKEPISLFDLTEANKDIRKVVNIGIDYFGGAFKKPNLTMVWNRAEMQGMISYHAGCYDGTIIKGLSGTGKTTLTIGNDIEQDDALVGLPICKNGKIEKIKLVGLEAASFAKSEGIDESSPEWRGLVSSLNGEVVIALNIDCEGVEFVLEKVGEHEALVPKGKAGKLKCKSYEKSKTTNGRFIFKFSILNKNWKKEKYLRAEGLSFRRYDILEPILRVIEPEMAVAFDSACETVITSAIEGGAGKRVRRYAATDFMAGEQASQAWLKLKAYSDIGLDRLVFFVVNTGYVGQCDVEGKKICEGEKIKVEETKRLISLVVEGKVRRWVRNPVFGYLLPEPREIDEYIDNFSERFNLLRFYSSKEIADFYRRDIEERSNFLKEIFEGQEKEKELKGVINFWNNFQPDEEKIKEFYEENYR